MRQALPRTMTKSAGGVTATSLGTTLTGGAANAKGSWVSLLDPILPGAQAVHVFTGRSSSTRNCLDLGLGPTGGGSEVAFLQNMMVSRRVNTSGYYIRLPRRLPPGARLSARNQSSGASGTLEVATVIEYGNRQEPDFAIFEGVGVDVSGDTEATTVDPGTSDNTKGAYSELIASTTVRYAGFYVGVVAPATVTGTPAYPSAFNWLLDIAIGTTVIVGDILLMADSSADYIATPISGPYFVPIPLGSQIQARCQCSTTADANYRDLGVYIIGIR